MRTRKQKKNRVKAIKRAIGRLKAPTTRVIPDKREKAGKEEARKEIRNQS